MKSTVEQLISKLIELDIQIELVGDGNLKINTDISEIPADVLSDLKAQKSALIDYLNREKSVQDGLGNKKIPKAEALDFYPASSAQKRLYFLQGLSPDSTSYNMRSHYVFDASLDKERLGESLQELVNRHETLRTSFAEINGMVVQFIEDEVEFPIEYHKCNTPEEADQIIKQSVQPFDLGSAPLLRSTLVEINNKFLWMIDAHHIISDGTSHQILISDMMAIYQGEELPPVELAYKDYSEWQNGLRENGELEQQYEFWAKELDGKLPHLNFPSDYPRPKVFSFEGAIHEIQIDKNRSNKLRALGEKHGGTLQMSLVSMLKILLFKYTKEEDLIVGCGISGRSHADLERVVGMFVNMLAIRSAPKEAKQFSTFYKEVIATSLDAYENQDVQFDDLVDTLKIERDVSRNPIFDISLVVQNYDKAEEIDDADIVGAASDDHSGYENYKNTTTKFDITFHVHEQGDELHILIEYYTAIFKESTIKRIAEHFNRIVDQILDNNDILLADIDLLTENEQNQILNDFNDTETDLPLEGNVHDFLSKQCANAPNKIAVSDEDGSYTYAQIEEKSNRLGNFLKHGLKIPEEAIIGILQTRSKELMPSTVGILKSGGAFLNLDSSLPHERLLYMIKDAKVKYIITEKKLAGLASRLQWRSGVEHIACVDSEDFYEEHGGLTSDLSSKELWDFIGDKAEDAITAGGWLSSFTGEAITSKEMQEYSDNAYLKLKGLLHKDMRILEIGCASGITMFQLAPEVASYHGTDLSSSIIEFTQGEADQNGHDNVHLTCMPAHEIDRLGEKDFDLVIINSVIQCFEDHNYLRDILKKATHLLKDEGFIFAGDIMDEDKRETLIESLSQFKHDNGDKGFTTKTDLSSELFVSRNYFTDLISENNGLVGAEFSNKIFTIANELTDYRYDALLKIDKNAAAVQKQKSKKQYDLKAINEFETTPVDSQVSGRSLCYTVYTSGSTGKPKGVMIEHRSLINLCTWKQEYLGMDNTSISTQFANVGFDALMVELFPILLAGGKLEIIPESKKMSIKKLLLFLQDKGITHSFIPTPVYHAIVSEGLQDLLKGMKIWVAGDRLKYGSIEGLELYNCYGPTEFTVCATASEMIDSENHFPVIGGPINNTNIFILNGDTDRLAPIGMSGEICIAGIGLARGYLDNPELTKEKFVPNPFKKGERLYRSGDLGRWTSDGNIEFIGRKDDQVKIRGYRIELGEIEHALLENKEIEEVIVLAKDNQDNEKELVAYITAEKAQNTIEIRDYLQESLPEFMLPAYFVQLDKLPLTANGKIDKRLLLDPEGLGGISGGDYLAPRDQMEEKLVMIWEELLHKKNIGVKDDFFTLGGHSLKAMGLANEYEKEMGVEISLNELFVNTTIISHAELIIEAKTSNYVQIDQVEEQASYAVSDAQRRLWVLSQFGNGSIAYHMRGSKFLNHEIDIEFFKKAIDAVIKRHEILRTVFRKDENQEIRQWVLSKDELGFEIDYKDFRGESNKEDKVQAYIAEDAYKPFDLENGPLLRASLIQVQENGYVLYHNMHHIISDGWSMEVLTSDIWAYYRAFETNLHHGLAKLEIQYKDYSAWQLGQLDKEEFKAHEAYWLNALEGELPVLDLPSSNQRPKIKTNNGKLLGTYIDAETTRKLKTYTEKNGGSLFMGMLTAWNILMYQYTAQKDIIIGSSVACRDHSDLMNQIGFYSNTLALRNQINPQESFNSFFSTVKESTLEGLNHQTYPFIRLAEKLNIHGNTSRNAIFDVMMFLQNNGERKQGVQISDEKINEIVDLGYSASKFDLNVGLEEVNDLLSLELTFNPDVYDREMIEGLINHFKQLLKVILEKPKAIISQIDYLSAEEKQELLHTVNNNKLAYPEEKTILTLFEEQVAKTPDSIALVCVAKKLTYTELDKLSNQLAHALKENYEINSDDLVGIMLDRNEWNIVAILAILKVGGAYVPIEPEESAARKEFIITDSNIKVLLTEVNFIHDIDYYEGNVFAIDVEFEPDDFSSSKISTTITPDNLAYVIYTSGSTGQPKGVLVSRKAVVDYYYGILDQTNMTACSSFGLVSTIAADLGNTVLYAALLTGGSLHIISKEDIMNANKLRDFELDCIKMTPSHWKALQTEEDLFIPIKCLILGGEPFSEEIKSFLKAKSASCEVYNHYGPTETTIGKLIKQIDLSKDEPITLGKPIGNNQVYLLNENQQLSPIGVVGEISIGGAGLANGYLNQESLTIEKFIKNPFAEDSKLYKTGDLGKRLTNGEIAFVGRIDEQVKIRGYRIELGEIENALLKQEQILNAAVKVWDVQAENYSDGNGMNGEKKLAAYIVSNTEQNSSELRAELRKILPEYMLPSSFVKLDKLPLTPNGKVDKKALPDPLGLGVESGVKYVAPRNNIEEEIIEIISYIVGKPKTQIGIHDNFFDLGISSLGLIKLYNSINQKLNVNLHVISVFEFSTVDALATYIFDGPVVGVSELNEEDVSSDMDEMIDLM
ncbi:MAG: amino acid adenylation domain-containing protein [Crocinitomix sp.]|jgi:amino acid adenylation domain-containing protein